MPAYASLVQFRAHLASRRVAQAIEGDGATVDTIITEELNAVSGLIDTAALEGGYSIPINPTALSTNVDVQDRIRDMLVLKTIAMATLFLLQQIDDSKKYEKARERCEDWLKQLAKGMGLPVVQTPADDSLVLVVAPGTRPFTPASIECLRLGLVSDGGDRRFRNQAFFGGSP